jgi:cyclase
MTALRIIPCLDVSGGRVVKGVNFVELRDSGDPVELARRYFNEGADELTFLDVSATVEGRRAILDIVESCAEELFIPLTVGGGITKVEDVSDLLAAGADKVSLGSAGVMRPELLTEIAETHGSQVLVASLDIKRADQPSGFGVTIRGGRELTDLDAVEWAKEAQARGAGEILANSIDADGTKSGFDLELLELLRRETTLPIIASGGAGEPAHFIDAAKSGADALLAASIFHTKEVSISDVKRGLASAGYEVRL